MFLITICCLREVGLMSLTNEFDKKKTACLLGLCIRLSCSGRWHVAIDILIILKKGAVLVVSTLLILNQFLQKIIYLKVMTHYIRYEAQQIEIVHGNKYSTENGRCARNERNLESSCNVFNVYELIGFLILFKGVDGIL